MKTLMILAGGRGSRISNIIPKCMINIIDKPMINYIIDEIGYLFDEIVVVLGYKNEMFERIKNIKYIIQDKQLGSGDACKVGLNISKGDMILVISGDTPLITINAVKGLTNNDNDLTFLTKKTDEKLGYGRVFGNKIVEEKDLKEESNEINLGVYYVKKEVLRYALDKLVLHDEYYLSDIVSIIDKKYKVSKFVTNDEIIGINTLDDLEKAKKIIKKRIYNKLIENNNFIYDFDSCNISIDSNIKNSIIYPNTFIYKKSNITDSIILEGSKITSSSLFNVKVDNSVIENSKIDLNGQIGPYSHIIDSTLGINCCIGNYTEIKRSKIGDNFSARHLAYIADSIILNNVNIGCGVITSNYNGINKNKIVIGNNVFIGSNSNLVAPLVIKDNSYISSMCLVKENVDYNEFIKEDIKIIKKRNVLNE